MAKSRHAGKTHYFGLGMTLRDIAAKVRFSELLARFVVHYDHEKDRPMPMVQYPKG